MNDVVDVTTGELTPVVLTVDPEFKALIPPLSADEYGLLQTSILGEGCRDAIVVWQGQNIILDGHNRYTICTANGVPFRVVERAFDSRAAAKVWMLTNQLARRNLPEPARVKLALELKPALEEQARERMESGKGDDGSGGRGNTKNPVAHVPQGLNGRTRDKVAAQAGVSSRKMSQAEYVLKKAPAFIREAYEALDIAARPAYELARKLEKAPDDVQAFAAQYRVLSADKVDYLIHLHKNARDTFTEFAASGFIQPGEEHEAVGVDAPLNAWQAAVALKAKIHRIEGAKVKQQERIEAADALPQLSDYIRGDCLDVLKTLPPKSVRLLLTDPPYGMDFQSNRRTVSPQAPKIEGDGDITGALDLLRAMLAAVDPAMQDECHLLVFTGWRYEPQFRDVLTAAGYSVDASLIWVKENHTSGDLTGFAPKHERILHARRGRLPISPRVPDVLMVAREGRTEHPTEKPVELLKTLIGCTTVEGEFVVDPFAGTGSVVTAARALKRRVLGIEKDDSWHAEGALMLGAA